MLRLILMRHAKSDWRTGLSDHERPLNDRGRSSGSGLGAWLRDNGYLPDQVLCSSATRTGQTLLALGLPEGIPTTFTRNLYLAEAEEMHAALRGAEARCVLMIGHNPGIAELAAQLVSAPPEHHRFADYPTGATLVVDFDAMGWNDIGWHDGQPIDFLVPKDLLQGGKVA